METPSDLPMFDDEPVRLDPAHARLVSLCKWLEARRPLIAFSGGLDSSFLAFVAAGSCPVHLAVTADHPLCPSWERDQARSLAQEMGLNHVTITMETLKERTVCSNPPDRCYHCKKMIMSELVRMASERGLHPVLDGTTLDDQRSYRPGARALVELGVISPLADHRISKEDIRRLSRKLGLSIWNKQPSPCLATRIPYGQPLRPERLLMVDRAEAFVRKLGYGTVRVRDLGDSARLELGEEDLVRLNMDQFRSCIVPYITSLGYSNVDMQPYRSGPWDPGSTSPAGSQAEGRRKNLY